jgi:6-phosphogluconolactonase/glucosamine-6-phosphate isomerase/deaminase
MNEWHLFDDRPALDTALAEADLPWDKDWITLVDERWVEPTHADSNERLVRENLLQGRARAAIRSVIAVNLGSVIRAPTRCLRV